MTFYKITSKFLLIFIYNNNNISFLVVFRQYWNWFNINYVYCPSHVLHMQKMSESYVDIIIMPHILHVSTYVEHNCRLPEHKYFWMSLGNIALVCRLLTLLLYHYHPNGLASSTTKINEIWFPVQWLYAENWIHIIYILFLFSFFHSLQVLESWEYASTIYNLYLIMKSLCCDDKLSIRKDRTRSQLFSFYVSHRTSYIESHTTVCNSIAFPMQHRSKKHSFCL